MYNSGLVYSVYLVYWRNVYSTPLHIFYWIVFLNCKSSLYFLDTNLLSVTWLANIFSHYVGYVFIFLMVSFIAQKFILMKSIVSIFFYFVTYGFDVISILVFTVAIFLKSTAKALCSSWRKGSMNYCYCL